MGVVLWSVCGQSYIALVQGATDVIGPVAAVNPLLGAIVALLMLAVLYLYRENRRKDKTIERLNAWIRDDAVKQRDAFKEMPTMLDNVLRELQMRRQQYPVGYREYREDRGPRHTPERGYEPEEGEEWAGQR